MKNLLTPFLVSLGILVFNSSFFTLAHAKEQSRHALVIGNTQYTNNPLPNPERDAQLISERLQALNFQVDLVLNASHSQMLEAIGRFEDRLSSQVGETVSFAYFAGHGVQIGGSNFLLPVDFDGGSEGDTRRHSVNADEFVLAMDRSHSAVKFLVLDACRDNPFENKWRSIGGGLAQMNAPAGTLIAYATSPGKVALDGRETHSPYTKALADALLLENQTAEKVFKHARGQVIQSTGQRQVPWDNSSLYGEDFYFRSAKLKHDEAAETLATQAMAEPIKHVASVMHSDQENKRALTDAAITTAEKQPLLHQTPAATVESSPSTPKRVLIVGDGAHELSASVINRVNGLFDRNQFAIADPYAVATEHSVPQHTQVSLSQAHRLATASRADYLIYVSVRIVGEQELKFYGRNATLFIAELMIQSYDVTGQRQLGQTMSKTLRYTSINALEQGRIAVDTLMPVVNRQFARLR